MANRLTYCLPEDRWPVPLVSHSGVFDTTSNLNDSNATSQYNYAAKHIPQVIFTDNNDRNNRTTTNPFSKYYAPLQQLCVDLASNRVANYNWITPNQYNDVHTALTDGFAGLAGDSSNIRQGDNFLSRIVPVIMASSAYREGGVIILWWDE